MSGSGFPPAWARRGWLAAHSRDFAPGSKAAARQGARRPAGAARFLKKISNAFLSPPVEPDHGFARRVPIRTAENPIHSTAEEVWMHTIIYLVGLLVIVVALLNFIA